MDIEEVFRTFAGVSETAQETDCELIDKVLNDSFGKDFDSFIITNLVEGITPKHSLCHLLIHFYRLGLSHHGANKDVEELQKLYKTE